ncbi:heme peroxidase [Aspergillus alliaceus]|uniref:linoleate 8R-lipoxygenase n=1 Tax=Petromyces alliaceus TaxID=209559 RepID=A0A5N7C6V9_PETAA|nr:heme peroxidase [Aspergillus alliaceus]
MGWLSTTTKSSWNPFSTGSSGSSLAKAILPGSSSGGSGSLASLAFGNKDQNWFQSLLGKFGFNGVLATILSFFLYALYLKFVKKDQKGVRAFIKSKASQYLGKIPGLKKLSFLKGHLPLGKLPKSLVPKATESALGSIAGGSGSILSKLNPLNWKISNKRKIAEEEDDMKYQAGEPYGDPEVLAPTLRDDLKAVGLKAGVQDLKVLLDVVKNKGKPIDDRDLTMEKLIAIVSSLPRNSKAREKLTGVLIDTLWQSLPHPPMTYLGNKYQYRSPDGSFNNPLQPDLGKAGSPYARNVPKLKHMHGVPPDPGLLFDLLMARSDETFKENPAGLSSVLFYHATIIIHDIFRSNRFDPNISDTSSYLDLAPLYGSSLEDQLKVRSMVHGLLKPDTFSEKRLIGMPPGVNAILVMYNRFHNYVAENLLKINEGGRFTLPPTKTEEDKKKALAKQDEDLFQTARLVTNGLYVNISLHDYIRGLANVHHSSSDWTLDPRVQINKIFDSEGVPRGIGNQVSVEFNLLYRFHSIISRRDEKWMNEFFATIFGDKKVDQLTPQEFIQGLYRFEQSIPEDPSQREFGGLKRGENGKFSDADLVQLMKESMEDPAGCFGARMVPKALRVIEILGIIQARKWQLASLNETRDFFKLKRHETFEDVNSNHEIADLLRKLYDDPDMVEMYPGLFLEDIKPRMDPGHGGCTPYTVGRAVFSDAVTLVRSDRFLTIDYTASNLTCWGYNEVQQDYDILGGSMFHKLFQRALPNWFPYNSLHITQPMYTRKMNEQIAREIGTIDEYTLDDPSPPPKTVIVTKHSTITKLSKDQANFRVIWAKYLNEMIPGRDLSGYMLLGDKPANTAQKVLVKEILYSPAEFVQLLSETAVSVAKEQLAAETLNLTPELHQVDIVRDVAIPMLTRILADLFCLDLKTSENPNGTYNNAELYKYIIDVRIFGFNNDDPGLALQRRKWAREGAESLTRTTLKVVSNLPASEKSAKGIVKGAVSTAKGIASKIPLVGKLFGDGKGVEEQSTSGSLRWYGYNVAKELIASGKTAAEVADISWMNAVGGVGATVGVFTDVLSYFLQAENSQHWEEIQKLAAGSDVDSANKTLRQYVLEAQRLTSSQRSIRLCAGKAVIDGQKFEPGNLVVCLLGAAGKDPDVVPDPEAFKLDRPSSAYIHFNVGPHECLGREIALSCITSLLRVSAGLKNLRAAPGEMGILKSITTNTDKHFLNDSWSSLTADPTTWKVHFEGHGQGIHHPPKTPVTAGRDLNALSNALKKQHQEKLQETISKAANGLTAPLKGLIPSSGASNGASTPGQLPLPISPFQNGNGVANGNGNSHPNILHQAVSSAAAIPQHTLSSVHDVTHHAVSHLPGGQQVTDFTHGLAHPFSGAVSPGQTATQPQQGNWFFLPHGMENAAKQVPGHLFGQTA